MVYLKNMNILLITQNFSTTKGGAESLFLLMAKLLADSGNKVWVITSKMDQEVYESHKNIKIVFVPPLLDFAGGQVSTVKENVIYSLCALTKGISIIKKEKIDIIHSNSFSPALVGSTLSVLTSVPHITTIHDVFSIEENYGRSWRKQENVSKLNSFILPIYEKLIIKLKSTAIHTVSEASKDDLIKLGSKKPVYVVDCAINSYEPKNLPVTPFQIMYIGRLVFYKNLEVVIKSLKILKKSYPEISLIIAGGGPQKKILEELTAKLDLRDNVQFKGYISEEEKQRLLCTSQALVFPSLIEGFGLVILEAFTCKKPVLVSNVRPLSDIVEDKVTGFVVSPHDENEWAKAIEKIVQYPEMAQKMGNAGHQVLENKYSVQTMQHKILRMYNEIIKQKEN